jgi:hypothetical protein
VTSVTVPAGSYVLQGSVTFTDAGDDIEAQCSLNGALARQFARAHEYGNISVLSSATVSSSTTFTLYCEQLNGSDYASTEWGRVIATKVGTLH